MRKSLKYNGFLLCLVLLCQCSSLQKASHGLWREVKPADYGEGDSNRLTPSRFLLVALAMPQLEGYLAAAGKSEPEGQLFSLPSPAGEALEFTVWKNSVVSEELLEKYPELQTYQGKTVSGAPATLRLENSTKGLIAMVTPQEGMPWYIAPYIKNQNVYMIFDKEAFPDGASPYSESTQ